jgi:hypothetical protein
MARISPKTKSLLPSLYKREELPLFEKEGRGEILQIIIIDRVWVRVCPVSHPA